MPLLLRLIAVLSLALPVLVTMPASAVEPEDTITAFAGQVGVRAFAGDGGLAVDATLNQPRDTAYGPDGSIYITDTFNHRIRRVAPDGTISTFAGNGSPIYNGDGIAATEASLYWPHDVTVDEDGVVYIADSNHHRIRRVGLDGIITTVLGKGVSGSSGDGGQGTSARIKSPKSVSLYGGGLYMADLSNKVRRLDLTSGVVTRVAGTGVASYTGDGGSALNATLNGPQRIDLDSVGNLYIADTLNHAIRRVDVLTGTISTVAGTGAMGFSGDGGQASSALLKQPRGLTLEGDSTLYIADSNNQRIRKMDLVTGTITTVAGSTRGTIGNGGPASAAKFYQPRGLSVTPDGRLLIADTLNSTVRVITPTVVLPPVEPVEPVVP